jgi:hypothetical protein
MDHVYSVVLCYTTAGYFKIVNSCVKQIIGSAYRFHARDTLRVL